MIVDFRKMPIGLYTVFDAHGVCLSPGIVRVDTETGECMRYVMDGDRFVVDDKTKLIAVETLKTAAPVRVIDAFGNDVTEVDHAFQTQASNAD